MRLSVLSRPAVAIAALAVGSAVLAAVPATAATPSGITRAQVLHAADMMRDEANPFAVAPATNRAMRALANRACSVDHDREAVVSSFGLPVASGSSADGLFVMSMIADPSSLLPSDTPPAITGRYCAFGALATTGSSATLSGTAKLTTDSTRSYALSGDAYVTPARYFTINLSNPTPPFNLADLAFTATGNATTSTKTTSTKTVKTPKTKAQLKSAKKKYSQALAAAKKSYEKALKKAGSNKSKKAAAKKAYAKKKTAAKAAYKKRIATTKVITVTTVKKTPTPFDVQASIPAPPVP